MDETGKDAAIAAALRTAGYDLPPTIVADVARGHGLLAAVLARIGPPRPEAEPATTFRPETQR
ncbi:hypothetical protein DFH01_12240 [Falsiroseomonas bella]|uniref:Uncharacterized protein n=1 Tax=Falsiroseomonas bella TaxID=2184016 RepID=A0A317FFL9_9PROT|nr:hypothetical protein [Falsiroseomonas bella]PWS37585.1 hypothetical protein DFH01_12240 [Falsiroseomonas bella]